MITYDYNSDVLLDFDENFPWTYDHLFLKYEPEYDFVDLGIFIIDYLKINYVVNYYK